VLFRSVVVLCTACSTDNSSGQEQGAATKPPPQVRVETLPSATALPPLSTETVVVPTLEPTPAQVFVWPTPDEDAIGDEIDSLINEIDNKLRSQDINIKP
jgi:hypothetical protein